jgi:hypothetical protein
MNFNNNRLVEIKYKVEEPFEDYYEINITKSDSLFFSRVSKDFQKVLI